MISDEFELQQTTGETSLNFLTPLEVQPSTSPNELILTTAGSASGDRPVRVRVEFAASKLEPTVERIPLTDNRLAHSWGTHLNRLVFRGKAPTLKDTWNLRVTAGEP